MAREKSFQPEVALDKAVEQFWISGYKNTSFDELVEATGVSRYGLYGTFGNKKQLFLEAIQYYAQHKSIWADSGLLEAGADFIAITDFFHAAGEKAKTEEGRRGCFLCNAAIEEGPNDPEVASLIKHLLNTMIESLENALLNAIKAQQVSSSLDAKAAANHLACTLQGIAAMARAGCPEKIIDDHVKMSLAGLRLVKEST